MQPQRLCGAHAHARRRVCESGWHCPPEPSSRSRQTRCHVQKREGSPDDKAKAEHEALLRQLTALQAHMDALKLRNKQLKEALGDLPGKRAGSTPPLSRAGTPGLQRVGPPGAPKAAPKLAPKAAPKGLPKATPKIARPVPAAGPPAAAGAAPKQAPRPGAPAPGQAAPAAAAKQGPSVPVNGKRQQETAASNNGFVRSPLHTSTQSGAPANTNTAQPKGFLTVADVAGMTQVPPPQPPQAVARPAQPAAAAQAQQGDAEPEARQGEEIYEVSERDLSPAVWPSASGVDDNDQWYAVAPTETDDGWEDGYDSSSSDEEDPYEILAARIKSQSQSADELLYDDWESMDIVFVSAEVAPWSKTGGLGDVVGSLPKALAARGHRVMVVTPRYLCPETEKLYDKAKDTGVKKVIDLGQGKEGGGCHDIGFFHMHEHAVDWVFVDHISYHRPGNPYGNQYGVYKDNLMRFSLLSLAAIEATLLLNIGGYRYEGVPGEPYGQRCLFIANDWHAALLSVYLPARFKAHDVHKESRCILALHNLAHQGSFPPSNFPQLGLPGEWYDRMEWVVNQGGPGGTKSMRTINCLKGALVTADRVITVSQNYAAEICDDSDKGQGCGLASLLAAREKALRGIVNGVDTMEWDPATDKHIQMNYTSKDFEGKAECKAALQEELRLPIEPDRPLLGFIGRLDYQKGPDLVLKSLEYLINLDCQVVILGSGAADYEQAIARAQEEYPYFVRGITKFDVPMSHKIIAGCDILLMPSRFEPCGLNQLYAMRYGTVPVAASTGGLRDTITDFNSFAPAGSRDRGTGWTFWPPSVEAFVDAISECIKVYEEQPEEWRRLMVRGMRRDCSWGNAARQYETVFLDTLNGIEEAQAAKEAKSKEAMEKQMVILKKQAEEQDKLAAIQAAQEAAAAAIRAANAKALAEKQKAEGAAAGPGAGSPTAAGAGAGSPTAAGAANGAGAGAAGGAMANGKPRAGSVLTGAGR